ncbi:MAG TPA: CHAP domain-containing protein [Galbitalea sp.]|jgi:surface antigen
MSATTKKSVAKRPTSVVASSTASPATHPSKKARSGRLSYRDRKLARRLAVTPRAAATAPRKSGKRQNPVLATLVLLVISGVVAGIALPAFAALPNSGETAATSATSTHGKQNFAASATIESQTVQRDKLSATTEAQLKAEQVNAAALVTSAGLASYPGKRAPGDDYPWRTAGYGLSPLNYYYRQCVDFVAWRLNRDAGVTAAPWKWTWSSLTPNGGDASAWKAAWESHGWKTSATPVVGAVAWFVGNHVAYVNSISGSNVVIEEYNGTSSRAYAMRTIPIDTVGRFLYPPP